jgi:hypothetical protein
MKFEIPFNKEFFIRQNMFVFELIHQKNTNDQKRSLGLGLFFLAIGVFFSTLENTFFIDYFFTVFGGILLYFYLKYRYLYKKLEREYRKYYENLAKKHIDNKSISIWELTDSQLIYIDYKIELKVYWKFMNGFRQTEKRIFLDLEEPEKHQYFILDKEEVGEILFEEISKFVQTKLTFT